MCGRFTRYQTQGKSTPCIACWTAHAGAKPKRARTSRRHRTSSSSRRARTAFNRSATGSGGWCQHGRRPTTGNTPPSTPGRRTPKPSRRFEIASRANAVLSLPTASMNGPRARTVFLIVRGTIRGQLSCKVGRYFSLLRTHLAADALRRRRKTLR